VWKIGCYNMAFLLAVSVVYWLFNDDIMRLFSDDASVIAIGAEWLRILSYSYFVYGWWMVSVQAFNGAGDTRTPTLINVVFFWLLQIPLSWWLAIQLDWAELGVFWGVFISETAVGLFTLWLFSKGSWKSVKV
jgi:Na+-driven multidrug efflux pump